jgi:hypothetical protein
MKVNNTLQFETLKMVRTGSDWSTIVSSLGVNTLGFIIRSTDPHGAGTEEPARRLREGNSKQNPKPGSPAGL